MPRISILAVVAGTLFDFLVFRILSYFLAYAIATAALAEKAEVTQGDIADALRQSPLYPFGVLLIATIVPAAAGFLAARIARHAPLLHGVLAPSLRFAFSLYLLVTAGFDAFFALVILLGPLCGLAGGWLGRRKTHTSPGVERP